MIWYNIIYTERVMSKIGATLNRERSNMSPVTWELLWAVGVGKKLNPWKCFPKSGSCSLLCQKNVMWGDASTLRDSEVDIGFTKRFWCTAFIEASPDTLGVTPSSELHIPQTGVWLLTWNCQSQLLRSWAETKTLPWLSLTQSAQRDTKSWALYPQSRALVGGKNVRSSWCCCIQECRPDRKKERQAFFFQVVLKNIFTWGQGIMRQEQ